MWQNIMIFYTAYLVFKNICFMYVFALGVEH